MVYRSKPTPTVTRLTGSGLNQDTESPYWEGSSAAEAASTSANWTAHVRVPSPTSVNDPRGVFTPIAGGIQFNYPGTYEVEISGNISGGAAGAREGILMYTAGAIVPTFGGSSGVMAGNLLYTSAVSSARHYTAKIMVSVTAAGGQVKFQDYVQTATSHTCTLTRIRATKVVQGGPGPQGIQGIQGPVGPVGTRWGYTNIWAFADSTDIACTMFDGDPPQVGDMLMSLNGFSVGDVYIVTAVYPVTNNVDVMYNSPPINLKGPQGTRWGTTLEKIVGGAGTQRPATTVVMNDGGLPRAGDIIQSLHPDVIGDLYFLRSVTFDTNVGVIEKFNPEQNLRGATGPAGSALSHWPVDSVYISFVNTNPATMFGGTWTAIGAGRMLIGVDSSDTAMDAAGETGGSKTTTLVAANLPPHAHTINHDHGSGTVNIQYATTTATGGTATRVTDVANTTGGTGTSASAGVSLPAYNGNSGNGPGTSTAFTNLPPYLAVYMWRRTA